METDICDAYSKRIKFDNSLFDKFMVNSGLFMLLIKLINILLPHGTYYNYQLIKDLSNFSILDRILLCEIIGAGTLNVDETIIFLNTA